MVKSEYLIKDNMKYNKAINKKILNLHTPLNKSYLLQYKT